MKTASTILIVCVSLFAKANTWTQKTTFPGLGIDYPFSFSIGNKGYVGTGWDDTHTVTKELWEYDPASNAWTQLADFGGVARVGAMAFTINSKGYAGLGLDITFSSLQDFWEYDPVANTWAQKADYGGGPRYVAVGVSIGSMGYVSTGIGNYGLMNDLWQYDPSANSWTQKTSLPGVGRGDASGFVIGSNSYVIGGCYLAELWEYNSISDSWTQKADLPSTPRCDAAAFTICGKGYFGTGECGGGTYCTDFWQYNPVTNAWIQKADFPGTGRDEPAGFAVGNKGYIGMGSQDGSVYFYDFWEYTPDSACSTLISNFAASDTSLCENFCINFYDSTFYYPQSWQWYFPGGNPSSSTDQNPTNICYNTPGTFDVTLVTYNGYGFDTVIFSNYISVYAPPPFPTITQLGNVLTSSSAANYQWQFNSVDIPGATNQSYTTTQTGFYTVVITDSNGCASATTLFVVNSNQQTNFSASDTDICEKFCINFIDSSQNNPTSWLWEFPGGIPSSSTDQNPANICYNTPGIYDVTLITTNGGGTDTLTLPGYITVYTNPFAPVISQVGNTLTSTPATSYQWQLNTVDIPGATNQSFTISQSGLYTVIIGDDNGCTAQASVDATYDGVAEVGENSFVNVYPNPAQSSLTVELLNCLTAEEISVSLFNAVGQPVYSSLEKISSKTFQMKIDLQNIASGIYFIEIKSTDVFVRKKIVVAD